jgi:hypothetical protein
MFFFGLFLDGFDTSFLEYTQDELYEQALYEIEFGTELEDWLKSESGYSCQGIDSDCPKSLVFMNLDREGYSNEKNPDALIGEVFGERLTDSTYNVRLLERDRQGLNLIQVEVNGVSLPQEVPQEALNARLDSEERTRELSGQRQEKVGDLISDIAKILAPQDNIFFDQDSVETMSSNDDTVLTTSTVKELQNIQLSNELGERKSEMLRFLVDEYVSLYSCEGDFCSNPITQNPTTSVAVDTADYLFAYRISNFTDEVEKDLSEKTREATLKLHIRIINVHTGEIEVADSLIKTLSFSSKGDVVEKEKKDRPTYAPYSSLELAYRPHAPSLDVLQDPPSSLNHYSISGHTYSKRAFRGSAGVGFGFNNQKNSGPIGGETISSSANMWTINGGIDKIIFPEKAVKAFVGTGVNISSLSANEVVKGLTVTDANGEQTTSGNSNYLLSSTDVYAYANLGIMYAYNRWAIEVGYQYPYTSLYTNSSVEINENTDLLVNSYVPPATVRLGVHYKFCGTIPLPQPLNRGNTCQN